jgi:uncharacterized delta-60 repeat protein
MKRYVVVAMAIACAGFAPQALADEGDLDSGFGNGGTMVTPIGSANDSAAAMAIDAQGRIVVAGPSNNGTNNDFAVARYNPNGTLDTSFNGTGKRTDPIGSGADTARAMAIDAQGRIVVVGTTFNGSDFDFALVRYNENGTLDTTFNGTGKRTDPIGSASDSAGAVAIDAQGRIVVAGVSGNGTDNDFAVARYNPNGTLDTTFNGTGKRTDPIGSSDDAPRAMAIDAQGRIVVVGTTFNGSDNDFAVVRYNSNGTLDATFNGTGKRTDPIGGANDSASAMAIDAQGRIVLAGLSFTGTRDDFALARYNPNGTLDTTFNGTGKRTDPIGAGADDFAAAVAIDAQGRIVVAGGSNNGSDDDFAVARYNPNGTLDTTFNGTGTRTDPIGSGTDFANAVAIDAQGRIVLAGQSRNGSNDDFALARYIGDETPPVTSITAGPANGAATRNATPTFHFTANESNATFECRFDSDAFEECAHVDHQTAEFLDDGAHTFSVRATDAAGNTGSAATRSFTVDTVPPDPAITGKSTITTKKKSAAAKFKLAAGEAGATLRCRIDGGPFSSCAAGTLTTPKLTIGNHVLEVRSTDPAGNRGTAAKPFAIVKKR